MSSEPRESHPIRAAGSPLKQLLRAIEASDVHATRAAVAHGADVNEESNFWSPLRLACSKPDKPEVVRELIRLGAKDECALEQAAREHCTGSVKVLLENGYSVTQEAFRNSLYSALDGMEEDLLISLVEAGAEINHLDLKKKEGVFHLVECKENVELILKHGADPSPIVYTDAVKSPLDMAARRSKFDVVELLLRRGANVNHRERESGLTPLMAAAECGAGDMVAFLLREGADPTMEDSDGKTAAGYAQAMLMKEESEKFLEDAAYHDVLSKLGVGPSP